QRDGFLHRRAIGHGRANGGAGRGQDDAERGDKHAVGTRNRVIGLGWHWSRTRSVKGFAWSIRLGLCRPLRFASPPSAPSIAVATSISCLRFPRIPQKSSEWFPALRRTA